MSLIKIILSKVLHSYEQKYHPRLDRKLITKISSDSLLFYYGNIHSERGQDGILAEIFRRIGITTGTFVKFGAWDGVYLSNCRYLFERGYRGVFIEAHQGRFENLKQKYNKDNENVVLINAVVGAPNHGLSGKPLHELLKSNGVETESITFVSIDVDGPDLEIFEEMGFQPAVVLIEGGSNFSPYFNARIPYEIAWRNNQQPLSTIYKSVQLHGYTPVCFYQDTYLVRNDLGLSGKDVLTLYSDAWYFMPEDIRESLLNLRSRNLEIQKLESDYFGKFTADPLGYK